VRQASKAVSTAVPAKVCCRITEGNCTAAVYMTTAVSLHPHFLSSKQESAITVRDHDLEPCDDRLHGRRSCSKLESQSAELRIGLRIAASSQRAVFEKRHCEAGPTCLLISDSRFSVLSKARDQLIIKSLQDGAFSPAVVESTYLAVTDFERVQGAPSSFEDTSEIPA
jgi:hypothetical protein